MSNILNGLASGGISSGLGIISGGIGALIQGAQQRKNMKLQNKLDWQLFQDEFGAQNDRQDFLLLNQKAMEKQGMLNAGLNPAALSDSASAPMTAPAQTVARGAPMAAGVHSLADLSAMAQIRKTNAEAAGQEKDNEYKDQVYADKHRLDNASAALSEAGANEAAANIEKLRVQVDQISNDTRISTERWAQEESINWQKLDLNAKMVAAQVYELRERGVMNAANAKHALSDLARISAEVDRLGSIVQLNDAQRSNLSLAFLSGAFDLGEKSARYDVLQSLGMDTYQATRIAQEIRSEDTKYFGTSQLGMMWHAVSNSVGASPWSAFTKQVKKRKK